jgi:hypothetical protein
MLPLGRDKGIDFVRKPFKISFFERSIRGDNKNPSIPQ